MPWSTRHVQAKVALRNLHINLYDVASGLFLKKHTSLKALRRYTKAGDMRFPHALVTKETCVRALLRDID